MIREALAQIKFLYYTILFAKVLMGPIEIQTQDLPILCPMRYSLAIKHSW